MKLQLQFALSNLTYWQMIDNDFNAYGFYHNIIDYFEAPPGATAKVRVSKLLLWWDRYDIMTCFLNQMLHNIIAGRFSDINVKYLVLSKELWLRLLYVWLPSMLQLRHLEHQRALRLILSPLGLPSSRLQLRQSSSIGASKLGCRSPRTLIMVTWACSCACCIDPTTQYYVNLAL